MKKLYLFLVFSCLIPNYLDANICANTDVSANGFNALSLCQVVDNPNLLCCGDSGQFDAISPTGPDEYNHLVGLWQGAMSKNNGTEPNPVEGLGLPACINVNGCLQTPPMLTGLTAGPNKSSLPPMSTSNLKLCKVNQTSTLTSNGVYLQCLSHCNVCPGFGSQYQFNYCSNDTCSYLPTCSPEGSYLSNFICGANNCNCPPFVEYNTSCSNNVCSYTIIPFYANAKYCFVCSDITNPSNLCKGVQTELGIGVEQVCSYYHNKTWYKQGYGSGNAGSFGAIVFTEGPGTSEAFSCNQSATSATAELDIATLPYC